METKIISIAGFALIKSILRWFWLSKSKANKAASVLLKFKWTTVFNGWLKQRGFI
jgi:hypothetical protein